uniref:Uncharacterized protein n=1 Tax=Serinus canaria TaxID=9135 RepID=A0A8C9MIZ5_SERCA
MNVQHTPLPWTEKSKTIQVVAFILPGNPAEDSQAELGPTHSLNLICSLWTHSVLLGKVMLCKKGTFWIFGPSLLLLHWLPMNAHVRKPSTTRTEGKAKELCTYSFRFLIREDAGLSPSCEIAVNFEGVPGTPLVGIHPVFTWMRAEQGRKDHSSLPNFPPPHFQGLFLIPSTLQQQLSSSGLSSGL